MGRKDLLIAGGDKRMKYAGEKLADKYNVSYLVETDGMYDVILLPPVSVDSSGRLNAGNSKLSLYELTDRLKKDGAVLSGVDKGLVKDECRKKGIRYVNYMELPELALANAVPTAEAAIKIAIEETERTIWQSRIFVAGYGKVGSVLTERLLALGAEVTAGARKEYDRTKIRVAGAHPAELPPDAESLFGTDIIFNTVPVEIFSTEQLRKTGGKSVYIELASAPGGISEKAALEAGCRYVRAPGLPPQVMG